MIIAVVRTGGGSTPGRARLAGQLAALPERVNSASRPMDVVDPAALLARLADTALVAEQNGEGVAVVGDDLVVSSRPLLDVLDDPRPATRALIGPGPRPERGVSVGAERITEVATSRHRTAARSGQEFAGLLSIPVHEVARARHVWQDAAATVPAYGWEDIDPLQLALLALVRGGVAVSAVPVAPYAGGRSADLLPTVIDLDEDDLTWRHASRGGDGVWSTFVLRPISRRLSRRAVSAGLTPTQVTVASLILGLLAALLIALGHPLPVILGALLLQVSLVADCMDGEIARSTRRFSPFGAWLDLAADRVKEYAALAAIAVAAGGRGAWLLALLGLILQLTRHLADYAFADTVLAFWRRPAVDERPLAATDPPTLSGGGGDAIDRTGTGPRGRGLLHWLKQAIHLQIGERWLVLSAGLLLLGPRGTLVAYVVLVALGLAWVLTGWTVRTLTHARGHAHLPVALAATIAALRDDGYLGLVIGRRAAGPRAPAAWLLPPLLTLVEGVVLWAVTVAVGAAAPLAYAWLAVVAWHRYDLFYRSKFQQQKAGRAPVPSLVAALSGGWAVRVILLIAAATTGTLGWVLPLGAAWLALVVVPESLFQAYRSARPVTGSYEETVRLPLRGRLAVARRLARRGVAVPLTRLLMRLLPTRRYALVAGLPDSEENSLATTAGLAAHYPGAVVLVANDPAAARIELDRVARLMGNPADRVEIVAKRARGTYLHFVRAELVCYTHGLYDSPRPVGRRLHVNLWHGTGPKWNANANLTQRIGADAHVTSSRPWGREAVRALAMRPDTRLLTGNPRQDVATAATDRDQLARLGLDPARPLALWLPTFRSSDQAGVAGLSEGKMLSSAPGVAASFAAAAAAAGVQLVAKPHRLDADSYAALGVRVVDTKDILAAGLTLYELLGLADGLISDYSSVWVDLLDTETAIGLHVPDLAAYRRARGLNRPDLAVVAAELFLTEADLDGFFAAVASRRAWRPEARARCAARLELIEVAPGRRTIALLAELGNLARQRFGDDFGLPAPTERSAWEVRQEARPVTSS